jgi:cytidylate kinase
LGNGGAYVGQHLAKKMNIYYADRKIIGQVAKQLSVLEEDLESRDEKIVSFWQSCLQSYTFCAPEAYIPPQIVTPTDHELFKTEAEIIERIAKERSAIETKHNH